MTHVNYPFYLKKQSLEPLKSWEYGKAIISRTKKGTNWGIQLHVQDIFVDMEKNSIIIIR